MKILAILQNAWFKNPDKVQAIFDRRPTMRNKLIASFLFAGCLTGRRLQAAFGSELCRSIIWEEASPKIAGHSSGVFEADAAHIEQAIKTHKPDVIVCFGRIASNAVERMCLPIPVHYAPHPAARQNPMAALKDVAAKLNDLSR